jgi:hypothetical protein
MKVSTEKILITTFIIVFAVSSLVLSQTEVLPEAPARESKTDKTDAPAAVEPAEPVLPSPPLPPSTGVNLVVPTPAPFVRPKPVSVLGAIMSDSDKDVAILVIPTSEMKPNEIDAINEDLSIMARILDKSIGQRGTLRSRHTGAEDFFVHMFSAGQRNSSEALYLRGYGALFLTGVNFPLSPPTDAPMEEPEEDVDSVWMQTKQEINTPYEDRRADLEDIGHRYHTQAKEYDREKVEQLKRTITRTLKHATNIRSLQPDESVTVVVRSLTPTQKSEVKNENGEIVEVDSGNFMTISAEKSDIDDFAGGEIDYDQFLQKVRIIIY